MNRNPLRRILPCAALLLGGCAGVTHRGVPDAIADARDKGIRYYDTSPYLFIRTDNEGGLISELVYLPDTTKKRSVRPYSLMAKNTTTLTWEDGGLFVTGTDAEVDTTDVPIAVIGALEEAAKTFVKNRGFLDAADAPVRAPANAPSRAPEAYVFKIVKVRGQWGLQGSGTINPKYKLY
jgi:hypothetical protein